MTIIDLPENWEELAVKCAAQAAANALLCGDIEELVFCEDCGEDCGKTMENNCYPPRYCHACRHKLVEQICELRAELEAARQVADAAVAVDIARNAAVRVSGLPESVVWPLKILWGAEGQAGVALDAAVREYRKLMEGENAN